jgi:phosphate:Na+ symporter
MGSIAILGMLGGVALLLWGLRMVRSGIMRAFGAELRRLLSRALSNRFLALLAGIGVSALLQSSTATGLMMSPSRRAASSISSQRWRSCSALTSARR